MTLLLCLFGVAVLVPLLLPLMRRPPVLPDAREYDRAVYMDQLQELERDVGRGLVAPADAAGARLEFQRRLLAADAPSPAPAQRSGRNLAAACLVAVLVAGGGGAFYAGIGAPGVPDEPFVARAGAKDSGGDQGDALAVLASLANRLKADPGNADGWLLYARSAGSLRQWDQAAEAYRRLVALGRGGPEVQSALGEMLVLQAGGTVTPAAHDAFAAALKDDPKNDVAQYYMAMAAGQAGEPRKAIDLFQGLLGTIPQDSPMREDIAKRIREAARSAGLPAPELAQGTPPEAAEPGGGAEPTEQQKAMIEGMVAKLAARLQSEPNDVDGWMRLGRAYAVMGRMDAAADAYDKAAALRPDDAALRIQAAEGLMAGLKPEDPLPRSAVALLHEAEQKAPDEPALLWYLGVDAARGGRADVAKGYFSRLLARLPAGGDDAKMVQAAIDSLKGS
jgi:cytochrome c-type biogenesis protein CcmH